MFSAERRRPAPYVLERFNQRFKQHFVAVLLSAAAVGALFPSLGLGLQSLHLVSFGRDGWSYDFANLALGLMMLSASVQCELKDFRQLVARPKAAMVSLLVIYAVVPAAAALLSLGVRLFLPEPYAVQVELGLMLSALMPVAMTSSVWARVNFGNLSLLVALITLTTALALATVPLYFTALLGMSEAGVHVPTDTIVQQLVLSATVPLVLGLALRRFVPGWIERWSGVFTLAGNVALWAVVVANVAVAAPHLMTEPRMVLLMGVLAVGLNVFSYAVGLALSRALRLSREDAVALLFGSGMRSNSTGLVVGLKSFAGMPLVALPAAIYMVSQHLIAAQLTRALDKAGSRLLGPAIASEPASLQRFLERALVRAPGQELAVVLVKASGDARTLVPAVERLATSARKSVRVSDFLCMLPHGFGVVLVGASEPGAKLVRERMKKLIEVEGVGLHVACGVAHSKDAASSEELLRAAKPVADALHVVAPVQRERRTGS